MKPLPVIGWREWLALPDLGIPEVKAKIDTGARSSAIHAFGIKTFYIEGKRYVRFRVNPYQKDSKTIVTAKAEVLDEREVRDSGGHTELRLTILTTVEIQEHRWPIEITLTNRSSMSFRMLLGRQGVRDRFLVDPGKSFLLSPKKGLQGKTQEKSL
ncbi:MAG: ATP-dependent zinc protease [Oscillatoria sp. SIO1A7]|nr:ATP-dependent zinc protease [Oscillatoria sp. SIO1A7]